MTDLRLKRLVEACQVPGPPTLRATAAGEIITAPACPSAGARLSEITSADHEIGEQATYLLSDTLIPIL